MRKAIAAGTLTAALLVTSIVAASARDGRDGYDDGRRDPGPVLGFAGDVLAGAFKIATLPLTLLADVGRDGWHHHDEYYEEGAYASTPQQARDYYGADARYYGPPPGHYRDGR